MIDSTNPRQLADNIRKLWDKFKSISGDLLPSRSTATTGQILKLTGENKTPSWADEYSYTPPTYSETEVNTGRKWIDGKDVYCKVIDGTTLASGQNVIPLTFDYLVYSVGVVQRTDTMLLDMHRYFIVGAKSSASELYVVASQSSDLQGVPFKLIVYYTKPDPAPETRDDDTEPETKKTTKKKTK